LFVLRPMRVVSQWRSLGLIERLPSVRSGQRAFAVDACARLTPVCSRRGSRYRSAGAAETWYVGRNEHLARFVQVEAENAREGSEVLVRR
jgi:hypothetical protein